MSLHMYGSGNFTAYVPFICFIYVSMVTLILSSLLSLTPPKVHGRLEDEQHPVKHFHQVCSGYQCDSCGFPLSIQHPLYSRPDTEFPGCMDLLQHPQHLNICGLSKKCGKTRGLLLSKFCCQCRTQRIPSLTGGGWLADDPDHPSESLKWCRCGFRLLPTTRLLLPILCCSLLHHHVHQHHLAGPHKPGPLPKDSQALWEMRPAAGSCWSGAERSCLGGNAIFSITQRYSKRPATKGLWRQTEVLLHEEQSRPALAWRIQLLLSGSC